MGRGFPSMDLHNRRTGGRVRNRSMWVKRRKTLSVFRRRQRVAAEGRRRRFQTAGRWLPDCNQAIGRSFNTAHRNHATISRSLNCCRGPRLLSLNERMIAYNLLHSLPSMARLLKKGDKAILTANCFFVNTYFINAICSLPWAVQPGTYGAKKRRLPTPNDDHDWRSALR